MLFFACSILQIFISKHIVFSVNVNGFVRDCVFHDAEILDRELRTVTRSNGVETSWLAAGWPVDTKRYVTQVPNDISGRREDDLSPVPSFPQSLFLSISFLADVFPKKPCKPSLARTIFLVSH